MRGGLTCVGTELRRGKEGGGGGERERGREGRGREGGEREGGRGEREWEVGGEKE